MKPQGISTRTDWTLTIPCMYGDPNRLPRTIFVQHSMLPHFVENTLRYMDPTHRFVLISGGTDITMPRQIDFRFAEFGRGFSKEPPYGYNFLALVNAPQLIHWFCENHDVNHEKISTLPTGLVHDADYRGDYPDPASVMPLSKRPLKVLVSDRVRDGEGQWKARREVHDLCVQHEDFCSMPADESVGHATFVQQIIALPFLVCVHGGGIDPSPKAWESILLGTIPIIQSSTLDDAYQQLPVVFIQDWATFFKHPNVTALLQEWLERLSPYYEPDSPLRSRTLQVRIIACM